MCACVCLCVGVISCCLDETDKIFTAHRHNTLQRFAIPGFTGKPNHKLRGLKLGKVNIKIHKSSCGSIHVDLPTAVFILAGFFSICRYGGMTIFSLV